MNKKYLGVQSYGIKCPIIKEGDDIVNIVTNSVLMATSTGEEYYDLEDGDIIGVTESVVARSAGLYVTVDEIADDIRKKFGENSTLALLEPIYSRNRFSMILKGIARACKKIVMYMPDTDEVGNPRGVNPFTGVNIEEYYRELCQKENCEFEVLENLRTIPNDNPNLVHPGIDSIRYKIDGYIDCTLHNEGFSQYGLHSWYCFYPLYTLKDICNDKNQDFGVLGTNKATEEKLKLFPTKEIANKVCKEISDNIKEIVGVNVRVCCFGDGCFHSPYISGKPHSSINEFADPVSLCGMYPEEYFMSTPNEIKIKAFADDQFKDLSGKELEKAVQEEIKKKKGSLVGNMSSQGTTPRLRRDLVASLMDLCTGSGDRCTPITLIKNY